MVLNPWEVHSIDDFNYFCCPECVFRSKEDISFQAHALQNHELSKTFFNNVEQEDPTTDVKQELDENFCEKEQLLNDENYDYNYVQDNYEVDHLLDEDIKVSPEDYTDEKVIENQSDENFRENINQSNDFDCSKCNESYKKLFNLVKHFNKKHRKENDQYICPKCPKKQFKQVKFLYKHVRKTHIKSELDGFYKHDIKWINCAYCPKFFNQKRALETHITKCHQGQNKTVSKTQENKSNDTSEHQIKTEDDLIENNEIEKRIQCDYCPKYFEKEGFAKIHVKKCHPDKPNRFDEFHQEGIRYTCSKCNEEFNNLYMLTYHFNDHDKVENQWKCPLCPKIYSERGYLWRHEKTAHLNIKAKKYKRKPIKHEEGAEVLNCELCELFSTTKKNNLIRHMRIMHSKVFKKGDKIFSCEKCEEKFDFAYKLKNHTLKIHTASTHGKPNLCDKCNQKFDYPSDYIKHYQDIHGSLPPEYKDKETFVCDQCPRVFITKNHLGAHIERVHSKKYNSMGKDYVDSIKCSSCGKTFSSGNLYIQHYQSKHGDFPPEYNDREKFICDQCPKVFLEKHRLATHKRLVHANKPQPPSKINGFQCKFCDKKYVARFSLKEHVMKDHEKSTPFHCEQCSRSFGTSTYLKSHIRQVHERLKCDECGQEMCNTFILKRHKAKVHGVKNANEHQCKHCHLCFKLKNALTKHIAKIHPDVKFHE